MQNKTVTASAIISELQSSDMYISVRGRLCDLKTNANGVAVTEAFIDEIVSNEEKYIGIPLCADVRGLLNDRTIGHMYNRATGEFMSTIVGSMIHFEKEVADGNVSLIINARIMKRYKAVCSAIVNLFSENRLKFSFEITCGDYQELEDGTLLIDASENNYLEGVAIVTFPACEDAVAMELVAECLRKEGEEMADEEKAVEISEIETAAEEAVTHEQEPESVNAQSAEAEETVEATAEDSQTAEIVVQQTHRETDISRAYDTETGNEITEIVEHEINTTECHDTISMAEDSCTDDEEERKEEDSEELAETEVKDAESVTASEEPAVTLAEIMESIQAIRLELAAMKEQYAQHTAIAEAEDSEEVTAEASPETETIVADQEKKWTLISPFTTDISVPNKYRLLEKEEGHKGDYTLL